MGGLIWEIHPAQEIMEAGVRSLLPNCGVVARIGSGAAWAFGGLAYSLTIARDSGLPNSAIRFNTLHPIIASLFCDS